MPTETTTIGAIATKLFLRNSVSRAWAARHALFNILATNDITAAKQEKIDQIEKLTNTKGVAERWKWPVEITAPADANGGSYSRGGTMAAFGVDDNMIFGEQRPALYTENLQVPASDLDVHASAVDNEVAVSYLANKMISKRHKLIRRISRDLVATTQVAGRVQTLLAEVGNADVVAGIDSAVETAWVSDVTNPDAGANQRLGLNELGRKVEDIERSKFSKIHALIMGSGVHNFLVEEAEARNLPMYDVVQHFGTDANGKPRLTLETNTRSIRVNDAICIVDEDLNATQNTTVLGLNLDEIALIAAKGMNFEVEPWKKVRLETGIDAMRAQILFAGFVATFDRTKHFKKTNCKAA